jgi:signal transduction histidine kinase
MFRTVLRQNGRVVISKRAALGLGFGVIIGLLVLSALLAYRIQESFSQRSVAIHRQHVQQQQVVTSIRRLLYTAGISVRDFLLNPDPERGNKYLSEIAEMRHTGDALLSRLRTRGPSDKPINDLEKALRSLWRALETTALEPPETANRHSFVLQEIAPHRTAAGNILQDLESANHNALTSSEEEFAVSRAAAARNVLWLLAFCLVVGVAVALVSMQHFNALERQASARFQEVVDGKIELERLSKRLMEIQEEERTRLSRELHDEIVQNVAVLKIEITHALQSVQAGGARDSLSRARDLADRTVRAVRNISLLLRPSLLDDLGLGPALQWLTDDFQRRTGVACAYTEENLETSLPDAVNTCVYRVTQEALRNCEKHSQARQVSVCIVRSNTHLRAEIRDDGKGFATASRRAPTSLGVLGMRERAAALGGELAIESNAGQGTCVRLLLPLQDSGAAAELNPVEAHA